MTAASDLVARLLASRAEIVDSMIRDGYSAGAGALLAGIAAALDALAEAQGGPQGAGNNAARKTRGNPFFPPKRALARPACDLRR
jgi:hypothetical protein